MGTKICEALQCRTKINSMSAENRILLQWKRMGEPIFLINNTKERVSEEMYGTNL